MGGKLHSQRQTFRNIALFFLGCALVGIAVPPLPTDWRITLGIVGILGAVGFGAAWLFAPGPLAREAPDVLADLTGDYFECDGLCFAPTLTVSDGLCWFNVFCQNRYDRACRGTLWFVPMEGMSKSPGQASDVLPIIAAIECDAGEAAVVSFPYPIATRWQGKIMIYDVMGAVDYPGGRGKLVRSREGAPVRAPSSTQMDALRLAGFAALGLVGVLAIGMTDRPTASCELHLPQGVAEEEPPGAEQKTQTLWELDLPTGGFPVC